MLSHFSLVVSLSRSEWQDLINSCRRTDRLFTQLDLASRFQMKNLLSKDEVSF